MLNQFFPNVDKYLHLGAINFVMANLELQLKVKCPYIKFQTIKDCIPHQYPMRQIKADPGADPGETLGRPWGDVGDHAGDLGDHSPGLSPPFPTPSFRGEPLPNLVAFYSNL